MAETWLEIAADNRRSAASLCEAHHRSCINRAYYAVYSRASHALVSAGVTMPPDREGPWHRKLTRDLIETSFPKMGVGKRKSLQRLVEKLYNLRVIADYRPSIDVESADARAAIAMMNKAFSLLP